MSVFIKNEKNFVGYEYKDITVKHDSKSMYADGYTHFGWTLEGISTSLQNVGSVTMKFKRNRKLRHKAELTRLQRHFEACVTEIETLERSKIRAASAAAYVIGIVGTAFMAGSVFSYMANLLFLSILLAIPGFAGWALPYYCFRGILKRKTDTVAPFIDEKYDEIHEVCEKADGLLAK